MRSLRRGIGLGSRRSTNSTKETRFRHLLPLFWILHLKHKAHPALKSPLGSKVSVSPREQPCFRWEAGMKSFI
ncbi:hypothetical protein OUZ56_005423 [Daphnia magna]|uniref:Uncharacterized protein n=1 Tax=Daphnia magna TaxID=35525 RepID=A0ABQ9YSQ8_9CRUS|nr:hypothetical protein OUZ56_005423 [Daphnia magna]